MACFRCVIQLIIVQDRTRQASMADALQVITLKVTQLSSEIQDANTRSITANSKVSEQAAVIAQLERTVSRMSMQFLVFFLKNIF